jgi:chromosome segregation protein
MAGLEQIKLSGFKSFVDPTTVSFPGRLSGIVGPNGSGKSNIIDAIRWVVGESSAKQLRGDSTTDIIFNGSKLRKPVGQASVELIFENSDGAFGGEYAKYPHIAIRRVADRSGQSAYFLNGTRCRRRDVLHLVLGTGLSPRSYAIIEQGLISKLVEAKPEELRGYVEEAAGISRYKHRRQETENRIRNTKENMGRINDLLSELQLQLNKLHRQARAAEKYKQLKEKIRLLRTQLLGYRFQQLESERHLLKQMVDQKETFLIAQQTIKQAIETDIEKWQMDVSNLQQQFEQTQKHFYTIGGEVSRLEQVIENKKLQKKQMVEQLSHTQTLMVGTQKKLQTNQATLDELEKAITIDQTALSNLKETLVDTEAILIAKEEETRALNQKWYQLNAELANIERMEHVEETRLQHLEVQQANLIRRLTQIEEEITQQQSQLHQIQEEPLAQEIESLNNEQESQQQTLSRVMNVIKELQTKWQTFDEELTHLRTELQKAREEYVSVQTQQNIAMEMDNRHLNEWLESAQLAKNQRVTQVIQVEKGWEKAVEAVLGRDLTGVCIDQFESTLVEALHRLKKAGITLIESIKEAVKSFSSEPIESFRCDALPSLATKIHAPIPIRQLLQPVYIVDSLQSALSLRSSLKDHESFITEDGVWIGKHWVKISDRSSVKTGVIKREQALKTFKAAIKEKEKRLANLEKMCTNTKAELADNELRRDALQQEVAQIHKDQSRLLAKQQFQNKQIKQIHERLLTLKEEKLYQEELQATVKNHREKADAVLAKAKAQLQTHQIRKIDLMNARDEAGQLLTTIKQTYQKDKEHIHELQLKLQSNTIQCKTLTQSVIDAEQHMDQLKKQQESLSTQYDTFEAPMQKLQSELQDVLAKRMGLEKEMVTQQQSKSKSEHALQEALQNKRKLENEIEQLNKGIDENQMKLEVLKTRQITYKEQLADIHEELDTVLKDLPNDKSESDYVAELEKNENRIQHLGPINLAAIQEHAELNKRKTYLDQQLADLTEALNMLSKAIQKIDHETRSQFKETFDRLNNNFEQLFPRVFEGGRGTLALSDVDLLTAGINLIVKLPGKAIRSVQLMSGGEKALVAIALVFSLFQLNPAPFCLLDEVDAPLDDANVIRFCGLLKDMSEQVQLVFISHNKNTIKTADHLMGITMNEPGVSRVVSIDMARALLMVEGK